MIAPTEAAALLKTAETSRRHSTEIYRYNRFSPYFFIWGAAWTLSFSIMAMRPGWWEPVFPLTLIGAFLASAIRSAIYMPENRKAGLCVAGSFLVVWVFAVALFSVLAPDPRAVVTFFPLVFAAVSIVIGFWFGLRYSVIGVLLAAATLYGFHRMGDGFHAWMAIFAGGGLLATGFWLRRA